MLAFRILYYLFIHNTQVIDTFISRKLYTHNFSSVLEDNILLSRWSNYQWKFALLLDQSPSSCCGTGSICEASGLCKVINFTCASELVRGACTDLTWTAWVLLDAERARGRGPAVTEK